jgi:hypothetical protein
MTSKINFFIRCRAGGGFVARAQAPAMEAEAQTLSALRVAIKRIVRSKLGDDRRVCLLVGEGDVPRLSAVAAGETAVQG